LGVDPGPLQDPSHARAAPRLQGPPARRGPAGAGDGSEKTVNDLGLLRKDPAAARRALASRHPRWEKELDALLKLDESHRTLLKEVEDLRARRNAASQE